MASKEEVTAAIENLMEDDQVPNSVNQKLSEMVNDLNSSQEISLTVNKATSQLEDLCEDVNIPAFVKTQLWGILSLLSALEAEITS